MLEPPVPLDPETLVGTTLGSYRLVRLIGAGGMGWVFEGHHPVIGARVAIKVLDPEVASAPAVVERFFNEARAVNLIGHPNLVHILDLGQDQGRYFAVMELVQGRPLSTLLAERGALPFVEAAPLLVECAEALQAAHDRGIVHRDIKPDNILVLDPGQGPRVKIVDFGVAKLATAAPGGSRTAVGVVVGTPAYMSPEQAEGATDRVDGRSDVYALGVVMFQMATGAVPFQEASQVRTLMAHVAAPLPRPSAVAPGVLPAFERIIVRCLAKAPADRFQSMRALRDALLAARDEASSGAGAPPPVIPVMGGGGEDEPLPGAEMFEPQPPRPPERAGPPSPERLELDLPPAAPGAAQPPPPAEVTAAPPAPPAPAPARARRRRPSPGALAGLVAVLLLAGAGAAAFVYRDALAGRWPGARRPLDARSSTIAARPEAAPGGAQRGECPAGTGPVTGRGTVELQVLTEPPGARVRAAWEPAGCDAGSTPWRLRVPRHARVQLRYRAPGHPDREAVVTVDGPQTVLEALSP